MRTCSEMIIDSPRIKDSANWSIDQDFEISASLIQPTYDWLNRQGFPLSKIGRGKPIGCGFDLKEGNNRVTIYFYCYPSEDSKNTEGFIRIEESTTIPRLIFHIRNKKKELEYLERTFPAVSQAIEQNPFFTKVRWVSMKHHCSATNHGQQEK